MALVSLIAAKGYTFGTTELVTSAKLHSLVDSSTFTNSCSSDGTTGGTGSGGAGNQYVEICINGLRYKVLHDGTV